jgi:hypothetical protein
LDHLGHAQQPSLLPVHIEQFVVLGSREEVPRGRLPIALIRPWSLDVGSSVRGLLGLVAVGLGLGDRFRRVSGSTRRVQRVQRHLLPFLIFLFNVHLNWLILLLLDLFLLSRPYGSPVDSFLLNGGLFLGLFLHRLCFP